MVLSPPPKKPEELGFYMPNSPFAKIAEEDGLDFNADKVFKKAELSAAQKENDVFDEHHVGRRWAEKLALMTRKTGAFHELQGVRTPYGGIDEDGVDPWIPESQIQAAKEDAKKKLRVASRKYQGERLAEEHKKINEELLAKIGRPKVRAPRFVLPCAAPSLPFAGSALIPSAAAAAAAVCPRPALSSGASQPREGQPVECHGGSARHDWHVSRRGCSPLRWLTALGCCVSMRRSRRAGGGLCCVQPCVTVVKRLCRRPTGTLCACAFWIRSQ